MLVRYTREIPDNTTILHRVGEAVMFTEYEALDEPITDAKEFMAYIFDYIKKMYTETPQIYMNKFRAVLDDGTNKTEIEIV